MTKQEFEDYLVSIGGLTRNYRAYKGPIVEAGWFQVKEGWYDLIKNLIDDLIKLGWNKKINQVKQKFGVLQVYIEPEDMPEDGWIILANYVRTSCVTCEICGQPSILRKGDWLQTLCDEHSEGREELKFEKPSED